MKIYEISLLENNEKFVWLDNTRYSCKIGKHCMWIPSVGIKIPWMFNGKVEAYHGWDLGMNKDQIEKQIFNDDSERFDPESFKSIKEEYIIMRLLAQVGMAPPVGSFVYIKNMITPWLQDSDHCDPMGCIGYEVEDANKIKKGAYELKAFEKLFVETKFIELSPGAIGDTKKEDNTINGYLIDIRRTIWDMMHLTETGYNFVETKWPPAILNHVTSFEQAAFKQDKKELVDNISKLGQFPYNERKTPYQTYILDGTYKKGTRQTLYRMDKMEIDKKLSGKSVLSLGCQLGSICNECYVRGARHITGIDSVVEYIKCARDIARYNHFQVNYQVMDLMDTDNVVNYIVDYYKNIGPMDIVFLLSMYKHIGIAGWQILDRIKFKTAYIESNNCPGGYDSNQAKQIERELCHFFGCAKRIGTTDDRSPRCLWRVTSKND